MGGMTCLVHSYTNVRHAHTCASIHAPFYLNRKPLTKEVGELLGLAPGFGFLEYYEELPLIKYEMQVLEKATEGDEELNRASEEAIVFVRRLVFDVDNAFGLDGFDDGLICTTSRERAKYIAKAIQEEFPAVTVVEYNADEDVSALKDWLTPRASRKQGIIVRA